MDVSPQKQVYFLSDFHLGVPDYNTSLQREKKIVAFLEQVRYTAAAIFIVGDMFDFWYEYRHVVPKGYVRILGKLAEIADSRVPITFFTGNHDMWMNGYFERELNITVHYEPQTYTWNGKKFLVGHGDGLGPGDHGYKLLKSVFKSRFSRGVFSMLHPAVGIGVANYFSGLSRKKQANDEPAFLGEDSEWLIIYCRSILAKEQVDYFIFGHRHLPLDYKLSDKSRYINLGDWIKNFTYAVYNGSSVQLNQWNENNIDGYQNLNQLKAAEGEM